MLIESRQYLSNRAFEGLDGKNTLTVLDVEQARFIGILRGPYRLGYTVRCVSMLAAQSWAITFRILLGQQRQA